MRDDRKHIKKIIVRIGITFLGFLFSLLIAEVIVKYIKPQLTFVNAKTLTFDCFTKDPDLPFTLLKNHKCLMKYYLGDFNTYATLNSHGYRGREFSLEKEPKTKRILVLGDSFTFGHGVSDQNTYPFLLEQELRKKLQNIEVINAGYADGFSPDSYYVYLKKRGLMLKPDLIIMGFFVLNDIQDFSETVWEKMDSQGLPQKVISCCNMVDWKIWRNKNIAFKYRYPVLRDSHLFILLADFLQKKYNLIPDPDLQLPKSELKRHCVLDPDCLHYFYPEEQRAYKVLTAINKLVLDNQIPLVVVLLPGDLQLYTNVSGKYGFTYNPPEGNKDFLQKRLGEFFKSNNIAYLDLYPVFDKQKSRGYPYFVNDAHFNNLGNKITAETISDYLIDQKLIKD